MNAVEREPVETRVLNPTASEASYKPKHRSYRKTNLKKKFWHQIVPAPKCPVPKCPAPKRWRRIGDAKTAAPKRTRPRYYGSRLPVLPAIGTGLYFMCINFYLHDPSVFLYAEVLCKNLGDSPSRIMIG